MNLLGYLACRYNVMVLQKGKKAVFEKKFSIAYRQKGFRQVGRVSHGSVYLTSLLVNAATSVLLASLFEF